jgi:hypothetical protein
MDSSKSLESVRGKKPRYDFCRVPTFLSTRPLQIVSRASHILGAANSSFKAAAEVITLASTCGSIQQPRTSSRTRRAQREKGKGRERPLVFLPKLSFFICPLSI